MAEKESTKRPYNFQDLTGRQFTRLSVVSFHHSGGNSGTYWLCMCSCGTAKVVSGRHLTGCKIKSCGCLNRENGRHNHLFRHGLRQTPEYNSWRAAKNRCFQPKNIGYANYGGRGITICDEWKDSFLQFLQDMGPCPEGMTLERKDVNGNYCPTNCCWATRTAQARNRQATVMITHEGITLSAADWAERIGISAGAFNTRLRRGHPLFAKSRYADHNLRKSSVKAG